MAFIKANEVCEKNYKLGRTLGQGTFATVKMAMCLKDSTKWAVKIIQRTSLSQKDEERLVAEIDILHRVNHPNIVKTKEVYISKQYVYIVMEIMPGGELFDRIVSKEHYSEAEAKTALRQIVSAIDYCHDNKIVHRDLKPENLLYDSPREDAALKLADFGLACLLKSNEILHLQCGTPGYVAPEILTDKGEGYGEEVDMWSIGVILYILLAGFPPFDDDDNQKMFELIKKGEYTFPDPYFTNISEEAKDLVSKLLVVNPTQRMTAKVALDHPWLSEGFPNRTEHLEHFHEKMAAFNARRRFKGAIKAIQMVNTVRRFNGFAGAVSAAGGSGSAGGGGGGGASATSASVSSGESVSSSSSSSTATSPAPAPTTTTEA